MALNLLQSSCLTSLILTPTPTNQPWFLDGKLTSDFRGDANIDGSFLSKRADYMPASRRDSPVLFFDWKNDPSMASKGGFDIVEALSPDGIWGLLERGKVFARQMEENGDFELLPRMKLP